MSITFNRMEEGSPIYQVMNGEELIGYLKWRMSGYTLEQWEKEEFEFMEQMRIVILKYCEAENKKEEFFNKCRTYEVCDDDGREWIETWHPLSSKVNVGKIKTWFTGKPSMRNVKRIEREGLKLKQLYRYVSPKDRAYFFPIKKEEEEE